MTLPKGEGVWVRGNAGLPSRDRVANGGNDQPSGWIRRWFPAVCAGLVWESPSRSPQHFVERRSLLSLWASLLNFSPAFVLPDAFDLVVPCPHDLVVEVCDALLVSGYHGQNVADLELPVRAAGVDVTVLD